MIENATHIYRKVLLINKLICVIMLVIIVMCLKDNILSIEVYPPHLLTLGGSEKMVDMLQTTFWNVFS